MLARRLACAMVICVLLNGPGSALAICRVVEPIQESGGVHFDPNTLALYVLAPDQVVGHECVEPLDAGPAEDTIDEDAGASSDGDGGIDDDDGGEAFVEDELMPEPVVDPRCDAGLVSVPVEEAVVHMVVQPAVLTTGGRAGLVMPVPARPDIHAANADIFDAIRDLLQPRIKHVKEYVEDPALGDTCGDPKGAAGCDGGTTYDDSYDPGLLGNEDNDFYDDDLEGRELAEVMVGDDIVRFEEVLSTPDYDVTVVNAESADALEEWMDLNGFAHDEHDDAAFAAYLEEGAWFVALEVHPQQSGAMSRPLAPLVVSWRGTEIPLLHRLQYHPHGGELTTEAFVMAPHRVDAADGTAEPLYAAPIGFGGELAGFGLAGGWLTQLRFTREMDEMLEDSALVGVPNFELRPELERIERIRVPSSDCERDRGRGGGGCFCSLEPGDGGLAGWTQNAGPALLACLWLAVRSRRRRQPG